MSKEFKRGKKAEQNGDYAEAVKQFRLAADKDNTEAQVYLAAMLAQGRGVPQDWTAAATLLQPLADKSVPEACYSLALQYLDGNGVEPDAAKAAELLRTAGTKGHMAAQFRLGGLYATGSGVDKDEREAVRWYRKASEQSFPPAQNALGWMYEHQRGVDDKDEASCLKQALKYYRKAAEVPAGMIGEGFAVAQANLARMYATGKGLITKDHKEAVKWFRYAHLSNGLVVRAPHRMPGSSTGKPPCRAMSTRSSSSASCTSTAPACHSICERPACGTRWPPSSATSPPCISSASCTTRPSMSACRAPLRGNATTAKPSIGTRLPPSVAMPRHSSRSACATLKAEVSHTHTLSLSRSISHSLPRCHRISGIAADIPLAMAWCSKSAGEGKHAPAMQYLGEIYNRGLPTVPKDPTLAAQWFRLASDPDATVPSYSTDAITGAGAASTSTATLDSGASTAVPSAHSPDLECHMKCHSHTDVLARRHSGHRGPPA